MPRGGARVNSGPPPDPNALRRDRKEDKAGWTILPAEGRQGDLPVWPLPADAALSSALEVAEGQAEMLGAQIEAGMAPRGAPAKLAKLDQAIAEIKIRLRVAGEQEGILWVQLWATPQAVAWEKLRWTREVALYTRLQVQAELGDLNAAKEARQWSDRLGLNPTAMLRNRWKVDHLPAAPLAPAPAKRSRKKADQTARDRLTVLQGGSNGGEAS